MNSPLPTKPIEVIHRLIKAGNEHDLQSFIACFASDYLSEPPNHPTRAFQGRAQVEKNWSAVFEEIPDFRMALLDQTVDGNRAWIECEWLGTLKDQTLFHWQGVTIFTIEENQITAGHLYMGPVEEIGKDVDETVMQITKK